MLEDSECCSPQPRATHTLTPPPARRVCDQVELRHITCYARAPARAAADGSSSNLPPRAVVPSSPSRVSLASWERGPGAGTAPTLPSLFDCCQAIQSHIAAFHLADAAGAQVSAIDLLCCCFSLHPTHSLTRVRVRVLATRSLRLGQKRAPLCPRSCPTHLTLMAVARRLGRRGRPGLGRE